ncbi:MAG TPA: hypothetical protein VHA12_02050 [Candidatus Nanoarchaeia archaeon]|nr:hypothetical protein [Candidatus Nanoarchaeia archaeon]
MKRLFKFKYPKIGLLIVCTVIAYLFFSHEIGKQFLSLLGLEGYFGSFIAGILFSFGFTTPFAIGAFAVMSPGNVYLASIIGGLGAMLADLTIFKIIKISFMPELRKLMKNKTFKLITEHKIPFKTKIKNYFMYAFSGIIIASPLPDEIGITMLASISKINAFTLAIISFICNTLGILIILLI